MRKIEKISLQLILSRHKPVASSDYREEIPENLYSL